MSDVTRILDAIQQGDPKASETLLPLVYEELRRLASLKMAAENPGQTLQATALVHEAYVRLVDGDRAQNWDSRGHFFSAAAEAMRRILVEQARRKKSLKRGGEGCRIDLNEVELTMDAPTNDDILDLNEALAKLHRLDPVKAELVKLRYFAGLTVPQVAQHLDISPSTADNYWAYARCWLRLEMSGESDQLPD